MTREEIASGVRECIARALDIEEERVTEESRLIEDLGGDSLDWLDILFQLEEKFYVAISPRAIDTALRTRVGEDVPLHDEGIYTPQALAILREIMPEVPPEELYDGMPIQELPRVFRVGTMINLVQQAMEQESEA